MGSLSTNQLKAVSKGLKTENKRNYKSKLYPVLCEVSQGSIWLGVLGFLLFMHLQQLARGP